MKRRIGCWIALVVALALAIFARCNDQFGFGTAIIILVVLPIILLPINIVAAFDEKPLIEMPIISIAITIATELATYPINDLGLHTLYIIPTILTSIIAFTLTRFLKTKLVKCVNK